MSDAKATAEDKFEKLREKYNQLKQANAVLKKGLLDRQQDAARQEEQLKEKETTIRQQMEEIDHLQYQNSRAAKQVGTLTSQVEELQRQKQQSAWSVGGLLGGRQQEEETNRAQAEIRVLRDELTMKIEENQDLHMQLFEATRQQEEEAQRFAETDAARSKEIETQGAELQVERDAVAQLTDERDSLCGQLKRCQCELEEASALNQALRSSLDKERGSAGKQIGALQRHIARLQPFDERRYPTWGGMNSGPQHARASRDRGAARRQLHDSSVQVGAHCCHTLRLWAKAFTAGSEDGESAARLKVRIKLSEALQGLVGHLEELTPSLVEGLAAARTAPPGQERQDAMDRLLRSHRRWVVYQSLLLMHDWSSAAASRPAQETQSALQFVDFLWRLHRAVRMLCVRLRLVACVSTLGGAAQSAQHFSLARTALRRRAGASGVGCDAVDATSSSASSQAPFMALMGQIRQSLDELVMTLETLGRCASAWFSAHAVAHERPSQDASFAAELLESLHRVRAALCDRIIPALGEVRDAGPRPAGGASRRTLEASGGHVGKPSSRGSGAPGASSSSRSGYTDRALGRLQRAPDSVGFEETQQMQNLLRQLSMTRSRLSREVGQHVKQLQALANEKGSLAEQLRELQDNHALLRSNYQSLQDGAGAGASKQLEPLDAHTNGPNGEALGSVDRGAGTVDVVLSSRQRALMESLSVTAQESASLRQHGFFVDVISLTPGEVALAAGPPDADGIESWEMAVRKVYEQHARNLQVQVQAADGKAMKLHLSMADNMDVLREQEDEKQRLRNEVGSKNLQLESIGQDIALTRKNYDQQLAMLTEHICDLSGRLSDKDAGLASLQTHKILCGHCATWNAMGKLLSREAGGMCQTCKEKVLSLG